MQKRLGLEARFHYIELRIGDIDETPKGRIQFTENPLVASMQAGNTDPVAEFVVMEGGTASGRYLTLQFVASGHLEVREITVLP